MDSKHWAVIIVIAILSGGAVKVVDKVFENSCRDSCVQVSTTLGADKTAACLDSCQKNFWE